MECGEGEAAATYGENDVEAAFHLCFSLLGWLELHLLAHALCLGVEFVAHALYDVGFEHFALFAKDTCHNHLAVELLVHWRIAEVLLEELVDGFGASLVFGFGDFFLLSLLTLWEHVVAKTEVEELRTGRERKEAKKKYEKMFHCVVSCNSVAKIIKIS